MITRQNFRDHIQHINSRIKPDEQLLLFDLAREVPENGTIIEIGSCYGASSACLGLGSKDRAKLLLIDNFTFSPVTPASARVLKENLECIGLRNFRILECDSFGVNNALPYDLCHIDGAHDLEHVWHDLLSFGSMSDVVVCHDYHNPGQPDVTVAVDKFVAEYPYRIDKIVRRMVVLRRVTG